MVVSSDLADTVEKVFPESYNGATLAKIGRNTFSSWAQTNLAPAQRVWMAVYAPEDERRLRQRSTPELAQRRSAWG